MAYLIHSQTETGCYTPLCIEKAVCGWGDKKKHLHFWRFLKKKKKCKERC